jgi:hypothetical protein
MRLRKVAAPTEIAQLCDIGGTRRVAFPSPRCAGFFVEQPMTVSDKYCEQLRDGVEAFLERWALGGCQLYPLN